MSESVLHGDGALARLVAWGQARPRRRTLGIARDAASPLVINLGAARAIRWVIGDVQALPFDNGTFDLVTCHLAAHRFPHAALAVREVQRVLAPGGSFVVAEPLGGDDPDGRAAGAYRRPEWHAFLRAAGLTVMEEDVVVAPGSDRVIVLRAEKD